MKKVHDIIKYLFVPQEKNNYRAKAIHLDFLTYYLVIALVLTFAYKTIGPNFHNILGFATDVTVDKLLELTNNEREDYGLSSLTYNKELSQAAQKKAEDMFEKNYWSHYTPDGLTPWDFILSSGYQYEYAGENLAKNFLFSNGVVDAWMNSVTHKENIVRKEYSDVGFAIVNGVLNGEQTTLVVQMFGKPSQEILAKETSSNTSNTDAKKESEIIPKENPSEELSPAVLAKVTKKPKINLFNITFDLNFIFLALLFIVLLIDVYFASRVKIVRLGGKNFAHLIFIGFIFISLFIFAKGIIL